MKRSDVEHRVRQIAWPAPSEHLRARVLAEAAVAERRITTSARVAGDQDPARHVRVPISEPPRVGHGWRRVGVPVALGILIVAGSCSGLDVWAAHQVDAVVARLEAKYGSLDERTLAVPAVPPWDNRAHVVKAAAALAVRLPGSTFHHIDFRAPAPVPSELRAFAEANRQAVRLAGDVRTRRQSNWEIDYRKEILPQESIRILSDAIYLTALLDLEAGRADDATSLVVSGLGVSASLRQEPGFGQYMRTNETGKRQIEAIREIVTRSEPSPGALEELAWWLAENRTPDPAWMDVLSGLKHGNAMFARMESGDIDPNVVDYIYPMTWPSWPSVLVRPAARIGRPFVREARLRYLRHMEQLLDLIASPRPHAAVPEPPEPQRWALVDRLTYKFTFSSGWEIEFFDDFMSELGAAEVAVALRRYRLDRGAYPDDLSALAPAYLESLPIDPYTGVPPVYARQGAGFTLRAKSLRPETARWRTLEWNVPR